MLDSFEIGRAWSRVALSSGTMSPFRHVLEVELGPLTVGLEEAACRAIVRLPRGGRVLSSRSGGLAAHVTGAIGSAGVLAVSAAAAMAWATGWHPSAMIDA